MAAGLTSATTLKSLLPLGRGERVAARPHGATLANNGKNPATGEQVIKPENIPRLLATMTMAGLSDTSGYRAWHVGLPAKGGLGGGIVAVVPGKGAIAVFAPALDQAGNSVKAQKVIEYASNKLGYNLFSPSAVGLK